MRRFELGGERFWEITLNGARVEMKWGAIDGAAQTFGRTFPTEGEAETFAERQIIAQRERGYVESTPVAVVDVAPEVTAQRHQRFEDSASYVEVTQEGAKLTVRGGRIVGGKDVVDRERLHVQNYAHVGAASVAFDERCARIRHGGARAIEPEPTHAFHANPELEAQCEASPDASGAWTVYADWLIAHGDARGEIAALQQAHRTTEAKRILGTHLRELCGTDSGTLAFEYRHGFAVSATITVAPESEPLEDVVRAVLASPMGRFLENLRFGLADAAGDNDWSPTIHAVGDSPRGPRVRSLAFDHYDHGDSELSWVAFGDFSGAWRKLPALERLVIKSGAGGELGRIELPNLVSLTRISGGLSHAELDAIVCADWPKLARLELWCGGEDHGAEATLGVLAVLLAAHRLPVLAHLGICNCELVDELIPELARSELLPRLTSLDLSKGTMSRDGAAALVVHADAFRHLAAIDLSENFLAEVDCEQLHRVLPSITFGQQREVDDDEPRYVAVGE